MTEDHYLTKKEECVPSVWVRGVVAGGLRVGERDQVNKNLSVV